MPLGRIAVNLTWTNATGSPGANVFHGRVDSGATEQNDWNGIANALESFYTTIRNIFPSTLTASFDGVVFGVGPDEGTTWNVDPWSVAGTATDVYAPPANALYVNWGTNTGGRRGRGRTFLGPVNLAVVQGNGTPDEIYRTLVQAGVDALIEFSDSFLNGAVGIYSRVDGLLRDITTGECPNKFASLRSRRD